MGITLRFYLSHAVAPIRAARLALKCPRLDETLGTEPLPSRYRAVTERDVDYRSTHALESARLKF
ncbi:hypothetical protein ALC53_00094 [Atta colombica]|uniref:Uncharacterized protein n=1 Tax=Atta colombica TaxID=520822 RepID=A0A195BX01_9HYME|nr:hypothetical protein ALC53_00094 [Atta colombica]